MSNDSITEITHTGWLGRIVAAIKGILIGFVLLLVGGGLLFWNEGRAVKRAKDLAVGARDAITIPADAINPAHEGKLVFLSVTATTPEQLKDSLFGIAPPDKVLKFRRQVSMYQWKETEHREKKKKLGGGETTTTTYRYSKTWSDHVIDSGRFHSSAGHTNPSAMPYPSQTFVAQPIKAGAFDVPGELVNQITGFEPFPVPAAPAGNPVEVEASNTSATVARPADLKVVDGEFYKGADPANPQVGDAKIAFSIIKPGLVGILAKQSKGQLLAYPTENGGTLFELRPDVRTREEMITVLEGENTLKTWLLRLGGFLAISIGLMLIVRPLVVLADVLPFLGDLLGAGVMVTCGLAGAALSATIIGIAWLFYRPVLGGVLLGAALFGIIALKRLGRSRRAATAPAPPPIPPPLPQHS